MSLIGTPHRSSSLRRPDGGGGFTQQQSAAEESLCDLILTGWLIVLLLFGVFQTKLLEEKNTVLMQTNVSLEEELRKANATKGQLETYKRQVGDVGPSAQTERVLS